MLAGEGTGAGDGALAGAWAEVEGIPGAGASAGIDAATGVRLSNKAGAGCMT